MTDENATWRPDAAARPNRALLVVGAAAAVVILATVGAVGGWVLAGGNEEDPGLRAGPPTTRPTVGPVTTPPRSPRPSASQTTPPSTTKAPSVDQVVVPNLVGMDFKEARTKLRKLGLGWSLTFGSAGSDPYVVSTVPPANRTVKRGTTVKLSVLGASPPVSVPRLTGQRCQDAAKRLVDEGLYPEYATEREGQVQQQDPEPGAQLRWNDKVRLHCGARTQPTSSPTP